MKNEEAGQGASLSAVSHDDGCKQVVHHFFGRCIWRTDECTDPPPVDGKAATPAAAAEAQRLARQQCAWCARHLEAMCKDPASIGLIRADCTLSASLGLSAGRAGIDSGGSANDESRLDRDRSVLSFSSFPRLASIHTAEVNILTPSYEKACSSYRTLRTDV